MNKVMPVAQVKWQSPYRKTLKTPLFTISTGDKVSGTFGHAIVLDMDGIGGFLVRNGGIIERVNISTIFAVVRNPPKSTGSKKKSSLDILAEMSDWDI